MSTTRTDARRDSKIQENIARYTGAIDGAKNYLKGRGEEIIEIYEDKVGNILEARNIDRSLAANVGAITLQNNNMHGLVLDEETTIIGSVGFRRFNFSGSSTTKGFSVLDTSPDSKGELVRLEVYEPRKNVDSTSFWLPLAYKREGSEVYDLYKTAVALGTLVHLGEVFDKLGDNQTTVTLGLPKISA